MASAKICGLTRSEDVAAAVDAGAEAVGAIVFAGSKRAVAPMALEALFAPARDRCRRVAVVVDPADELVSRLAATGALDALQLHGHEPPARVTALRSRTGLKVIKACPVREIEDVRGARDYAETADALLFDAKAPPGGSPGGNGLAFDWRLLADAGLAGRVWGLAGGLTPDNVADAVRLTGAPWVDVASGVESAPGIKDHAAIRAFVARAAASLDAGDG